jgi:FkbM family methyltransferase
MDHILPLYINAIGGSKALAYVGANSGQELPLCKKLSEKVYAFEPVTDLSIFSQLLAYKDDKTEILPVALSDKSGSAQLFVANNNYESSSLLCPHSVSKEFPHLAFSQNSILVPTMRLCDFDFFPSIDVLIIDVQGAEMKVLNGITDFSSVQLIILEYSVTKPSEQLYQNSTDFNTIHEFLKNHGFCFSQSFSCHFNSATKLTHANAIFLRM